MNLMQKYRDLMTDISEDTIDVKMTQARRDTLTDIMAATCDTVVKGIIDLGKWTETDQTRKLEADIVRTQKDVLAGRLTVIDFKAACERWKTKGIK